MVKRKGDKILKQHLIFYHVCENKVERLSFLLKLKKIVLLFHEVFSAVSISSKHSLF